jgi:hypothetical protein
MRISLLCLLVSASILSPSYSHAAAAVLIARAPQIVFVAGAGGLYVGVANAAGKKLPERDSGRRQPSPNLHEPSGNGDGVAPNFEEGRRNPTSHDVDYGPYVDEGGGDRSSDSSLFKQSQEKWAQLSAAQKAAAVLIALGAEDFQIPQMIQIHTHLDQLLKMGVFTELEIVRITEELKVMVRSKGELVIDLSVLNQDPRPADLIGAVSESCQVSRATARYILILVGLI